MRKAELEEARDRYDEFMAAAKEAIENGLHREGLRHSVSALAFLDGMIRHAERFGSGISNIAAIDMILKYAPLLLETESLAAVEVQLKALRRIEKEFFGSIEVRLAEARATLAKCYQLWTLLDSRSFLRLDEIEGVLPGKVGEWRSILEGWQELGIAQTSVGDGTGKISITSRFGNQTQAKCNLCGALNRAELRLFLEPRKCRACGRAGYMAILGM